MDVSEQVDKLIEDIASYSDKTLATLQEILSTTLRIIEAEQRKRAGK